MIHIMTQRVPHKLDFSKKLLLAVAGLVVIAAPVMFGLLKAAGQSKSQVENPPVAAQAVDAFYASRGTPSDRVGSPILKTISPNTKACSKPARKPVLVAKADPKRSY